MLCQAWGNKLISDMKANLCGVYRFEEPIFLKAAHPQRDGRSNEQITQQAERPTPPTTVRIDWTTLYLREQGNREDSSEVVLHTLASTTRNST
jgi:hypothetical protein